MKKWIFSKDNINRHPGIVSNVTIIDCTNMKFNFVDYIKYMVLK
jgi:hypothetical protein